MVVGDDDRSPGPVGLCRSVKDEKRGAAEIEPWPRAAGARPLHHHVSKANSLNTVSHILFQVQEQSATFIWLL